MKRIRPGVSLQTQTGYNLVVLAVAVTLLNILVAAALPSWSKIIQREKEIELIFRGMQYAEAIRVCQDQRRLGGLPTNPQQLLEEGCLRKLYKNPMQEDGAWRLIVQRGQGQPGREIDVPDNGLNRQDQRRGGDDDGDRGVGRDSGRTGVDDDSDDGGGRDRGRRDRRGSRRPGQNSDPIYRFVDGAKDRVFGPIMGVASPEGGDSVRIFMGSNAIDEWEFTAELAGAKLSAMTPSGPQSWPIHSDTFWRPWPPGITPPQLELPSQGQQGQNLNNQGQGGQGLQPATGQNLGGGQGGRGGGQGGLNNGGQGGRGGVDVRGTGPRGFGPRNGGQGNGGQRNGGQGNGGRGNGLRNGG